MTQDRKHTVHFQQGMRIFKDGDRGRTAYVVETGRVEIHKDIEGEKVVLSVIGPSEIFGELAPLGSAPRMASATALEDTICVIITEQDLKDRVEATDAFIQGLIRILVRSIRNMSAVLEELRRRS